MHKKNWYNWSCIACISCFLYKVITKEKIQDVIVINVFLLLIYFDDDFIDVCLFTTNYFGLSSKVQCCGHCWKPMFGHTFFTSRILTSSAEYLVLSPIGGQELRPTVFRLSNKLIIDKYCFVFIVSLGSVYFSIYSGFLRIHPHLLAFLLFIYSLYPRLHLLLTTNAWSFTSITRFQCRNTAIVVFLVLLGFSEESCIFRNKYYILLVLLIVCVNRLRFCS